MKNLFFAFLASILIVQSAFAGTVTGQIQTPTTGRGVANGTLTFTLTQAAVVSGTATLAGNANCWTDASGNVVGLPGDAAIAASSLSSNLGSGSLASGTYFVRYTWANATGESQPSAERSLALGSAGTLIVQAPVNVPAAATSMKVYIGAASGAETLQGSVAVTNGVLAGNYSQAVALVAGAALPTSNTSVCQVRFNDELQPSFTGYSVALANVNGAGIAGFPQKWYLSGGSNGTVNLSQGTPLYSGVVQYPQAIVSTPAASAQQSINGPLNLNGFTLTTGNVAAGFGSSSAPAYGFNSPNNTQGFYAFGGAIGVKGNCPPIGTPCSTHLFNDVAGGGFHQESTGTITWDSTTNPENVSSDTGISRCSAGVLCVGTGGQGNASGTVKAAALNGASLAGANNGNTVTLLNFQTGNDTFTGNSTDQTLYSYTIPANTIGPGKGFRVTVRYVEFTGTSSMTFKLILGSTTIASWSTADRSQQHLGRIELMNASGVQNSQFSNDFVYGNALLTIGGVFPIAENLATDTVLKFTFNVANTDQVVRRFWLVELIQ